MADALPSEVAQRFDLIRDADFDLALQTLRSMDVQEKDPRQGQTVLWFAAAREEPGALRLARECISMGVDVDVFDKFKQTPLFFAAKVGNLAVARLLLMLGMQPNFRDVFGQTALYYAVSYGHVSMVRLLVGMGAAADVACHLTKTPKDMTRNTKLKGELNKYILEQKQRAAQEIQRCGSNEDELSEVMSRQAQRLHPDSVCPDGQARVAMVNWLFRHMPETPFSPIRKHQVQVLAENTRYFICIAPASMAKRIRRSETGRQY